MRLRFTGVVMVLLLRLAVVMVLRSRLGFRLAVVMVRSRLVFGGRRCMMMMLRRRRGVMVMVVIIPVVQQGVNHDITGGE